MCVIKHVSLIVTSLGYFSPLEDDIGIRFFNLKNVSNWKLFLSNCIFSWIFGKLGYTGKRNTSGCTGNGNTHLQER